MEEDNFKIILNRLKKIKEFLNDPYKAPENTYSLILDVVNGGFDE